MPLACRRFYDHSTCDKWGKIKIIDPSGLLERSLSLQMGISIYVPVSSRRSNKENLSAVHQICSTSETNDVCKLESYIILMHVHNNHILLSWCVYTRITYYPYVYTRITYYPDVCIPESRIILMCTPESHYYPDVCTPEWHINILMCIHQSHILSTPIFINVSVGLLF